MGIAQKVSRDFSDAVRSRGQSYFAKGRVAITLGHGQRGRRAGPRDGQVPGPAPAPRRQAARVVLLPVLRAVRASRASTSGRRSWLADARRLLQPPPVRPLKLVSDPPRRAASGAGSAPSPARRPRRRPRPCPARSAPGPDRHPGPHAAAAPAPCGPRPRPAPGPWPRPGQRAHAPHGPAAPRSGRPRPKDRQASGRSPARSQPHPGRDPARQAGQPEHEAACWSTCSTCPATLNQNQVVIDLARRQRRPGRRLGAA